MLMINWALLSFSALFFTLIRNSSSTSVSNLRNKKWVRFCFINLREKRSGSSCSALFAGKDSADTASPEEKLQLKVSIEAAGFLKNIIEYGNNRMARRAVGILQKMPAYRIVPQEIHYTEAIWACEKSDQYSLAVSVYEEMKARGVVRTESTYAALISVAEKTDHFNEAIQYYNYMISTDQLIATTAICNSCLWAMGKVGNMEPIMELLNEMNAKNIKRDTTTYAASLWACDRNADAALALQLLHEMENDPNVEINTAAYNSALWACVKAGYWQDALQLFNQMDIKELKRDATSYNAAIWAAEIGENHRKAVELLRLMKFDGLSRETMSFDGAISAAAKVGDWSQVLDILKWMDLDGVSKSYVTYKLAIDVLDKYRKFSYIDEIYLECLRNGFFSPWVKKTRQLDLRGFTNALVKVAMKIVLLAMMEGKLAVFTLNIAVGDVVPVSEGTVEVMSSFDIDALIHYLEYFYVESNRPSHVLGEEDDNRGLFTHNEREKSLNVSKVVEDGIEKLVISREDLSTWIDREMKDM